MSPVSIAIVLMLLGMWLVSSLIRESQRRRHLSHFFAGRDEGTCKRSCTAAFPSIDERRVEQAYVCVQALVNYSKAPIQADDNLLIDLRVQEGDIDELFDIVHEWRGTSIGYESASPIATPTKVRDLIAELLANGFEGYACVVEQSRQRRAA